jgi:hypothetical protein
MKNPCFQASNVRNNPKSSLPPGGFTTHILQNRPVAMLYELK